MKSKTKNTSNTGGVPDKTKTNKLKEKNMNIVTYTNKETKAAQHHRGDLFEDRRDGEIYILVEYERKLFGLFCLNDGGVYDSEFELEDGCVPTEIMDQLNHLGKKRIVIS